MNTVKLEIFERGSFSVFHKIDGLVEGNPEYFRYTSLKCRNSIVYAVDVWVKIFVA